MHFIRPQKQKSSNWPGLHTTGGAHDAPQTYMAAETQVPVPYFLNEVDKPPQYLLQVGAYAISYLQLATLAVKVILQTMKFSQISRALKNRK